MKLASDQNFSNPIVGDTVRVQVPDIDRGKSDARSVLACVLEVTPNDFVKPETVDLCQIRVSTVSRIIFANRRNSY